MAAPDFVDTCLFVPVSTGTVDFVYASTVTGYQSPAGAGAVDGKVYKYRAQSSDLTQWENGSGVYTAGSTTLARTTITASSNAGAKVNFTLAPQVGLVAFSADIKTTQTRGDNSTNLATTAYVDTVTGGAGSVSGFRNRIINGGMEVSQRFGIAAMGTTINGYSVDRWQIVQSVTGKLNAQQNSSAVALPQGFLNYLGVASQGAYTVLAGDTYYIAQPIEGLNVTDFNWGGANAQAIVLSFWVRSSLTGTFGGAVQNAAANRSYPFTYTISSANTWEKKTVTIPGDTTGTWATDTTAGLTLFIGLGVGTTKSGTASTWAASNFVSATGAVSVVGTNAATFYLTGVQLELGSVATPFERRLYGIEFALCQRYYYVGAAAAYGFPCPSTGGFAYNQRYDFKVSMRAAPTVATTYASQVNIASINAATRTVDYFTDQIVGSAVTNTTFTTNYTATAEL